MSEVRSFLGLVTSYSKFVPNLATIAAPIYQLSRKNIPFDWNEACQNAFKALKTLMPNGNYSYRIIKISFLKKEGIKKNSYERCVYESVDNERHVYESVDDERRVYESVDDERHVYESVDDERRVYESVDDERRVYESVDDERRVYESVDDERRVYESVDDESLS